MVKLFNDFKRVEKDIAGLYGYFLLIKAE